VWHVAVQGAVEGTHEVGQAGQVVLQGGRGEGRGGGYTAAGQGHGRQSLSQTACNELLTYNVQPCPGRATHSIPGG
jgi:hypothetical protein